MGEVRFLKALNAILTRLRLVFPEGSEELSRLLYEITAVYISSFRKTTFTKERHQRESRENEKICMTYFYKTRVQICRYVNTHVHISHIKLHTLLIAKTLTSLIFL